MYRGQRATQWRPLRAPPCCGDALIAIERRRERPAAAASGAEHPPNGRFSGGAGYRSADLGSLAPGARVARRLPCEPRLGSHGFPPQVLGDSGAGHRQEPACGAAPSCEPSFANTPKPWRGAIAEFQTPHGGRGGIRNGAACRRHPNPHGETCVRTMRTNCSLSTTCACSSLFLCVVLARRAVRSICVLRPMRSDISAPSRCCAPGRVRVCTSAIIAICHRLGELLLHSMLRELY